MLNIAVSVCRDGAINTLTLGDDCMGEITAACSEIYTKHIKTISGQHVEFLGALVKFRKETINLVMCVRPSVGPHEIT